jgi:phosphatidylglycerophosphatase A
MTNFAQFATAFGIGRVRQAPGTVASLVAVLIAVPVMYFTGWIGMAVIALATTAFGVWVADGYGLETGIADPQDCVIDEFAGQWIACAIMNINGPAEDLWSGVARFVLAFLLFRLFDIAKPGLVKKAENLRGGLGIMADDVLAGVIAGFVVFLAAYSGFV